MSVSEIYTRNLWETAFISHQTQSLITCENLKVKAEVKWTAYSFCRIFSQFISLNVLLFLIQLPTQEVLAKKSIFEHQR